jgi:hypothetical protein
MMNEYLYSFLQHVSETLILFGKECLPVDWLDNLPAVI